MHLPSHPSCWFRALLAISFAAAAALRAQSFTTYDLIVPNTPVSGHATVVDGTGRLMPANRSYIIGVEGGLRGPLVFSNWTAANPNYPVIVVNMHGTGRVVIKDDGITYRDGIKIDNCAFFKLLGNNDPAHRYGFEIAQAGRIPSEGVSRISRLGVTAGATSTNVEIAFIEVHHTGFAGIMAKTDPQLSKPETWFANYTMHDLSVHDCYLHDIGGEGMYIGYNSWASDHWADVPGYEGHEILGLKIYNNLIERTQWDGFQYASAPLVTNTDVFNNVVIASGLQGEFGQANGAQIGAGASGRFFDNIIIDSVGNNLAMFGRGYNAIFNNLMINGDNGVFTDNRPNPPPSDPDARQTIPGSYYSFYHNTFINPRGHALWSMSEVTVTNFKNNLSVVPDVTKTDAFADAGAGASINLGGNRLYRSISEAGFADAANLDFRLAAGASGIDAGVSLAAADVPITEDSEGLARPQGSAPDAGYAESGPLSVFLIAKPPSAGSNGTVRAAVLGGSPPYTYAWTHGASTPALEGVGEGLYQVTVTDAAGASVTRATYLIVGASMGAPVSVTPAHQVHPPTFVAPSGTYASPQTVELSSATPGASIRYTLDGTSPSDTVGSLYSGPVSVAETMTIKAIAYRSGLDNSAVETATYIIDSGPPNSKFVVPTSAITASSATNGNPATNVNDGSLSTAWTANGDGQWIQFDLGENQRIGFVSLATGTGNSRSYRFDLLASTDGSNWTPILLGARTSFDLGLQKYDITDTDPVRYLRLVGHGSTYSATLNTYTEIEIWGGPSLGLVGDKPERPAALTATAGDTQVTLHWTAAAGAQSYNVKRATAAGGPYTIVAAGVTATNFTDTSLTNGTGYFYVVAGVNLFGAGEDSPEASATPKGVPPPTPTDVAVTAGDGQIGLTWSATPRTQSYIVNRAVAAEGPYQPVASGLITPSYIDLWLTNGVAYHYTITAVNVDGESPASASASATPQSGYPGIWHILSPVAWGQAGSAYCPARHAFDYQPTWDAQTQMPTGNDPVPHQTTLTGYANRFWYMDLGPDFAQWRITQMWTRYRPNSPGTYTGFASMWWDDDRDNVNDGIHAPDMNFSAGGTLANVNPQVWLRDRDFSAAPIAPLGRYLVVSTGPTVSSRPNEFAFVGYRDTSAPPAMPRGVTATAATPSGDPTIELNWNASPGATSYTVKRSHATGGPYALRAENVGGTTFTDTGLADGTTYFYVVSASNAKGESADSAEVSAIADATPPVLSLPSAMTVEATSAAGAVATFAVSAQDAVSGIVPAQASPASGSIFPLGVTVVTVTAADSAGNVASGTFTVTVRDSTPPAIQSVVASRTELWPANHRMIAVTVSISATDVVDSAVRSRIVSVASNEPLDGEDDGNTAIDWEITDDLVVNLRAERSGVGSGRVYTVTVESADAAGNTRQAIVQVSVPLSRGGGS